MVTKTATKPKEEKPAEPTSGRPTLANVHDATLYVKEKCPYVYKTGRMAYGQKYSYASEGDLIGALHDAMIEARLTLIPSAAAVVSNEQYPSGEGKLMHRLILCMTYTLTHAASNTSAAVVVMGGGCDLGDKAAAKAMTICYKYALKQAFGIETGDDPDRVSSKDLAHEVSDPPPEQYNPPAAPPKADKESFEKAMAAIPKAPNVETLQKYRTIYTERGFSQKSLASLEAAFSSRYEQLTKPEAQTANGKPTL